MFVIPPKMFVIPPKMFVIPQRSGGIRFCLCFSVCHSAAKRRNLLLPLPLPVLVRHPERSLARSLRQTQSKDPCISSLFVLRCHPERWRVAPSRRTPIMLAQPQPLEPFSQEPPSLSVLVRHSGAARISVVALPLPVLARHSVLSEAAGTPVFRLSPATSLTSDASNPSNTLSFTYE